MEFLLIFLKGLVLGFSIAAPVGPIGVLCIRRTLAGGLQQGLVSGLGAAAADAVYGCVAAFGLTAVSALLLDYNDWLRLLGGAFLLFLGVQTLRTIPASQPAALQQKSGVTAAFTSTFFLTLTNPMTILSFAAIFAGLGVGAASGGFAQAALLVAGVFSGSLLWWLFLSAAVSRLKDRATPERMIWVNRVSGLVIVAFGLVSLSGV